MTSAASPEQAEWRQPEYAELDPLPLDKDRERWWFSEGLWLDQGQTALAVGATWTHWLADLGATRGGPPFDLAFAEGLQRDAQHLAGGPVDDQSGAHLGAAAEVLRERGFIGTVARCPDRDTVAAALINHGPLVAGLPWFSGMFDVDTAGGFSVCRLDEDDVTPIGAHAALLNGITLDLSLDGVTGFVRLKSSWGRGWGDGGQVLISLDDIERLLGLGAELLLPVPPPDATYRPHEEPAPVPHRGPKPPPPTQGGSGEAPPEDSVRYEDEGFGSDLWTVVDTMGYGVYADAIARGIQHPDTRAPLTIGIKAPWGAGKTSLMRMVQRRLEWPATFRTAPAELRRVRLTRTPGAPPEPEAAVTNRTVLRRLGASGPAAPVAAPVPEGEDADDLAWRPTVWFNPWMYQTDEQVWAGFAHEIIGQTTARMSRGERERFWLELNLRRVDEQAVRRKVYSLVLERLLPWLAAALVVVVAGAALLAAGLTTVGAALSAGSPALLLVVAAVQRARVLGADVAGDLAAVVRPARAAGAKLAGALDELMPDPGYAARAGFFSLVRADVQRVLDLVATERRPLVVFIDDLDRCSPDTVVQVIEAINLFLAGELRNVIFVVAVEPEMVAAHIEAAYGDLVEKIVARGGPGQGGDLGWRFLEKFIQLPLTLPLMEPQRRATFIGSLFAAASDDDPTPRAEREPGAPAVAAAEGVLVSSSLGDVVKLAEGVEAGSAAGEALRRTVARRLTESSPEMQRVIEHGARFLAPNPREIKRFANVFRFLVMIATERRLSGLDAPDDLAGLAKLAILGTRWPALTADLVRALDDDGERTVLHELEGLADKVSATRAKALTTRLSAAGVAEPDRILLSVDLRRTLRAEPSVGAYARDWL